VLASLELEPDEGWYAGSALSNAWLLGQRGGSAHLIEAYEWDPETRAILAGAAAARAEGPPLAVAMRGEPVHFDGESHVAERLGDWERRDVVLLDPFGLWVHGKHAFRRARYRRIVDALVARAGQGPVLIWFWTWGRSFNAAEADLTDREGGQVEDGYRALRASLRTIGRRMLTVQWRWDLQFAMWLLVDDEHAAAIAESVQRACQQLLTHLGPVVRCSSLSVHVDHST